MFEFEDLPLPETITRLDDDELLDAIALAAGFESAVAACKLVAIDEYARRLAAAANPRSGPPRMHARAPRRPEQRHPSRRAIKRKRRKHRRRRHA